MKTNKFEYKLSGMICTLTLNTHETREQSKSAIRKKNITSTINYFLVSFLTSPRMPPTLARAPQRPVELLHLPLFPPQPPPHFPLLPPPHRAFPYGSEANVLTLSL